MPCLAGVLLDMSCAMRTDVPGVIDAKEDTWTRSVFTIIDDLIQYDVSESNHVFVFGIGARYGEPATDILGTLRYFQKVENEVEVDKQVGHENIENILTILETNKASMLRKWVSTETLNKVITNSMAILLLRKLTLDKDFTHKVVNEILPAACRDLYTEDENSSSKRTSLGEFFTKAIQETCTSAANKFVQATENDVQDIVEKAKNLMLKGVSDKCIYTIQEARDIFKGCVSEDVRDNVGHRSRHLFEMFEPFVSRSSPLFSGIAEMARVFTEAKEKYPNHEKVLFILSDGSSTENTEIYPSLKQLSDCNVKIVSCYISNSSKVEGKKLFCKYEQDWKEGAKFLFKISSTISTNMIARTIFVKRGWKIDTENNETRYFLHLTQQENLRDAIQLARNLLSFNDALADCINDVFFDRYVNEMNQSIKVSKQDEDTCYAHAAATVLHLAMKKIKGRDGGHPEFESLKDHLIQIYGRKGAKTSVVLSAICPYYRLNCREVDTQRAKKAICSKRPVVATFRLTDDEWKKFKEFFDKNPQGILRKCDLDVSKRDNNVVSTGHAVVLTSYNTECFHLMNSWGDQWADMGFFRVATPEVLDLQFIDVFWTKNNLTEREKAYFETEGKKDAKKFLQSLARLQLAHYKCPLCKQLSLVKEFQGRPSEVKCPKCNRHFRCSDGHGYRLALNFYLESLSVVENAP